ncbi:MAG: hypothetical protein ACUVWX_14915, partial [Kiritimatiellia bacterium]
MVPDSFVQRKRKRTHVEQCHRIPVLNMRLGHVQGQPNPVGLRQTKRRGLADDRSLFLHPVVR